MSLGSDPSPVAAAPSPGASDHRQVRTARFALFTLVFNIGVILWGAFVRATGSGAGCGEHWPTCNGEVLPRAERLETLIEFTHRATSGVALLLVVALLVLAIRAFPPRHRARRAAGATMVFMIGEALVGALWWIRSGFSAAGALCVRCRQPCA